MNRVIVNPNGPMLAHPALGALAAAPLDGMAPGAAGPHPTDTAIAAAPIHLRLDM
jgi:hypothetical protein